MKSSETNPILVIFPGALGDLICAIPSIEAIAQAYQPACVELIGRTELVDLLVGRTSVCRGFSIDRREIGHLFASGREDFGGFFDRFGRVFSFFAADDANFRANLASASSCEVSFHPFRPYGSGPIAQLYLESVGYPKASPIPRIHLNEADFEAARIAMHRASLSESGRFVAIFPGSGSPLKNWQIENFIELARRLRKGIECVAILGHSEELLANDFRRTDIPTISNAELATVGAIAKMAEAFVGNDSGVSHLASAAGARGVVIFGATDPTRWRPAGDVTIVHREPIEQVVVSEVADAIERIVVIGR
jgi:ADP-heptose:LPS heptosyltransferase